MTDMAEMLSDIKLRFHIDNPDLEECYAFGYECALANVAEEDNPFAPHTKESDQWIDGWWDGFYGAPLMDFSKEVTDRKIAANDDIYHGSTSFITKMLEIAGVLALSAAVGYQLMELVA